MNLFFFAFLVAIFKLLNGATLCGTFELDQWISKPFKEKVYRLLTMNKDSSQNLTFEHVMLG